MKAQEGHQGVGMQMPPANGMLHAGKTRFCGTSGQRRERPYTYQPGNAALGGDIAHLGQGGCTLT